MVYRQVCTFLKIEPQESASLFEKQNASQGKKRHYLLFAYLRNNMFVYYTYKTLKKCGLKISFPQKTLNSNVELDINKREEILKLLEVEIEKILKYGEKSSNFWK